MMLPLQLKIERLDDPESFVETRSGRLPVAPAAPRYHVTATVLDVERRRTLSYEFWSMVAQNHEPYEGVGRITNAPTETQVETLLRLRDALNEVLEEA